MPYPHDNENPDCPWSGHPIDAEDAADRYGDGCTCPTVRAADVFEPVPPYCARCGLDAGDCLCDPIVVDTVWP